MPSVDVKDKVVFITGANRGIGKSFATVALQLGAKRVYACSRDTAKLAEVVELGGDRIVPVALDVTNQEQVDAAVSKIHERFFTRECPFCAEIIKQRAKICKHCQKEVAGL